MGTVLESTNHEPSTPYNTTNVLNQIPCFWNKIQTFENEILREVVGFNGGLLVSASTYQASAPEFNTAPVQSFDSS